MSYEIPSVSFLFDHIPFVDIGLSLYKLYKENQKKKFRQKLTHFITTKYGETDQKIFDIILAGFTKDYQEKVVIKSVNVFPKYKPIPSVWIKLRGKPIDPIKKYQLFRKIAKFMIDRNVRKMISPKKKKKILFFNYLAEIKPELRTDFWKSMEDYFHYLLTEFPIIEQYCNKQSEFIEPFSLFSQTINKMNDLDFIIWLFPPKHGRIKDHITVQRAVKYFRRKDEDLL